MFVLSCTLTHGSASQAEVLDCTIQKCGGGGEFQSRIGETWTVDLCAAPIVSSRFYCSELCSISNERGCDSVRIPGVTRASLALNA